MKGFPGNLGSFAFGTLRRQIVFGVALVQAVLMSLFVWQLIRGQEKLLLDRQVEQATALAQTLAVSAAGWLAADNISGLQEIVDAQRDYQDLVFAMLTDRRGQVLAHTDPALVGSYLQDLPAAGRQGVITRNLLLVDVVAPAELGGHPVGWARVGISQGATGAKLGEIARSGLLFVLVAVLGCALLVGVSVRWFTRRLYLVQKTIKAVRAGSSQVRAHLQGGDEAAEIAREFNGMLDALAESEADRQRLHRWNDLVLQAAGEGIYGVDAEGMILFINPAAVGMLGYQPAELLGKHSHTLFHHTGADGTANPAESCPLVKSLREGAVIRGQDEVFWTRDGKMFPVEHINTPIVEEGKVVGAVVVFRDITERRRAEAELRSKTARLEEAQRIAHLGHWELDLRLNRLLWSDEVYRIFGLHPHEFAATYEAFVEMVHPEDRELVNRAYRESLRQLSGYDIEHRILLKSGEVRHVHERCVTEYDETGAPLRSLGTVLDITDHKRSQERLLLANMVIENSPAVLFRWRAAAGWPVEYVSENVSQFGYGAADLLSGALPFATIIHPDDLARVAEEVERHSAAGTERFTQEYRIVTAKGEIRVVEDRTRVERDRDGRVTHYQGVVTDITERKRLEGQLRQAQKMEAIGTLAGGIAHDFNNILTAIIGYSEIVLEKLPADSPLREDQKQVLKAGDRAKDLVKQILTFSRRSEQQLQPLLVQFIVKEALKLLRASIPANIEIREIIDVDCGAVMADPVQVHQVVMNICTNAYQAMREKGGTMTVSLRGLEVAAADAADLGLRAGPHALLEVRDTGCGMSPEVRERIFEPYFTTKAKGEGTGLGMPMVHGIVTSLGGRVGVYSEPGQGATIKIYLPMIASQAPDETEETSEMLPGGDEAVLVVDDEEAIVALEGRILEGLGYRVATFTDSEEALRAIRDNPTGFDLLLTDMNMPKLTGFMLAAEVLRLRPGMPVILCTGFSELVNGNRAKAAGIREFMVKPIPKADLARAVRRVLDEEDRALRPG